MNAYVMPHAVELSDAPRRIVRDLDGWLVSTALALFAIGLIMVASASVSIAERRELDPLYYFWRQLAAGSLGILAAFIATRIPLARLQAFSTPMLFVAIGLLVAV